MTLKRCGHMLAVSRVAMEVPMEGVSASVTDFHDGLRDHHRMVQVQFDLSVPIVAPLPGELPPTKTLFAAIMPKEATVPDVPQEPIEAELPPREPFGAWLLLQHGRKGWIGDLAKAAKSDQDFPKRGSPDDVRKRLQEQGADGDAFEAVDDAELDWASL